MKITIAGSLGNVGKPLALNLIAAKHEVTVISSNAERKSEIEQLGAKAAIGFVSDVAFLKESFLGADAVFVMTPPNLGGSNVIKNTTDAGKAFAEAIQQAGIGRVVMLSSIGADIPTGNGPIAGLYHIEQLYNDLQDVSVTYLRAGYFYTNLYNDVPMIKGMHIMGANYSGSAVIPFVHPRDIAFAAAEELQKTTAGKNVRYIISENVAAEKVAQVLGLAIGQPDLPWVEFTDEQSLGGMLNAGLPEEIAQLYTEMGSGLRNGIIQKDFIKSGESVTGTVKLNDFANEFAAGFNA